MEAVEPSNRLCAYECVVKNEGAPGADGVTVTELKLVMAHWAKIRRPPAVDGYMPVRGAEGGTPEAAMRGTDAGLDEVAGFDTDDGSFATIWGP